MAIKYYTKAETMEAVNDNGNNLRLASFEMRNDIDIVSCAIKNGASIEIASFGLQNDLSMCLQYAKSGVMEHIFERALFCAERDISLFDDYCGLFKSNREFILELKLYYGEKFNAPIKTYNFMNEDELRNELRNVRIEQIEYFRNTYKKTFSDEIQHEINESDDLLFSPIRIIAIGCRVNNEPLSKIIEILKDTVKQFKLEEDYYCSQKKNGSFPERVMAALLEQLGVEFNREVVFDWSRSTEKNHKGEKRYDFYLPEHNAIIEVHGAQHYDGGFEKLGGRSLKEEQKNDKYKEEIAKQNGINDYIAINAASSEMNFLIDSICNNRSFVNLMNLCADEIDWFDIQRSALGNINREYSFPFNDFRIEFYQKWISLLEEVLITSEPTHTSNKLFGRGCVAETKELRSNITNSFSSRNGLFPHEIAVLSDANNYLYPIDADKVPGKWYFDWGISNIKVCFDKLINKGFIKIGSIEETLQHSKVPTLKKFLSDNKIASGGKKEDLISRILENFDEDELMIAFPEKYYSITYLGELELKENKYVTTGNKYCLSVWTVNRMLHAFPRSDINDLLRDYHDYPRSFFKFMTEDEIEYAKQQLLR